jgi:hypothetical protein
LDSDRKIIALEGEEIGRLLAQSVQDGVIKKQPWYEPSNRLPHQPVIAATTKTDFDTLIVDESASRAASV